MRAIVYNHSSEEGIKEVELKPPKLMPKTRTHILVKVYYCGVNPVDAKYNVGDKLPNWLNNLGKLSMDGRGVGYDFSGIILETPKNDPNCPFPLEMRFLELCHQCMVALEILFWHLSINWPSNQKT